METVSAWVAIGQDVFVWIECVKIGSTESNLSCWVQVLYREYTASLFRSIATTNLDKLTINLILRIICVTLNVTDIELCGCIELRY